MLTSSSGLLHRQPGQFVAYAYHNVDFVVWEGAMTLPALRVVNDVHERRYHQLGRRISFISVLTAKVGFPDSTARAEIERLQQQWRGGLGCFVAVLEAEGMWRSALSGFMAALLAVSPHGQGRLQIATSLASAASWLVEPHARVTGVRLDRAELRAFLEGTRRQIASLSPRLSIPRRSLATFE